MLNFYSGLTTCFYGALLYLTALKSLVGTLEILVFYHNYLQHIVKVDQELEVSEIEFSASEVIC